MSREYICKLYELAEEGSVSWELVMEEEEDSEYEVSEATEWGDFDPDC
jgi:hypothetical protein